MEMLGLHSIIGSTGSTDYYFLHNDKAMHTMSVKYMSNIIYILVMQLQYNYISHIYKL